MAPVTLRDVAAAAGVSVSTVSKVVWGQAKGAQLSDLTVERVRDIVVQLGYVPNQVARSLRAQSTRQIGLVLGSMASHRPDAQRRVAGGPQRGGAGVPPADGSALSTGRRHGRSFAVSGRAD